jgi:hypothetical protein
MLASVQGELADLRRRLPAEGARAAPQGGTPFFQRNSVPPTLAAVEEELWGATPQQQVVVASRGRGAQKGRGGRGAVPQEGGMDADSPSPAFVETLKDISAAMKSLASRQTASSSSGYDLNLATAGSVEELESLGVSSESLGRLGSVQIQRLNLTREKHPSLVSEAHARSVRTEMGVLPGEAWSYGKHAEGHVLPRAAGHHGLRKFVAILAHALDLERTRTPEHTMAFLHQAYKAASAAACHPQKQWEYGWPLLGLKDPDGPALPSFTAAEHASLASFHREKEVVQKNFGPKGGGKKGDGKPHVDAAATPGGGGGGDTKKLQIEIAKLKKELAAAAKP